MENNALKREVHDVFKNSFKSYGAPRVRKVLLSKGCQILRPRAQKSWEQIIYLSRKAKIEDYDR